MRSFLCWCIGWLLVIAAPGLAQDISVAPIGNLLAVGNYNVNQGSSDLGAVVQIETDRGDIVVDEGHPVRYFFNKSNNNLDGVTDWMLFDYKDTDWEDGLSAVGYNSVQTTAVPDNDDQGAIYSRFELFAVPNAAAVKALTIRIDYDDGVVVWLNEVEVLRANMTTAEEIPDWGWGQSENHESTNIAAPSAARWNAPVSNLLEVGQDNAEGTIIDHTFDVILDPRAVDARDKLATSWAKMKGLE